MQAGRVGREGGGGGEVGGAAGGDPTEARKGLITPFECSNKMYKFDAWRLDIAARFVKTSGNY